jgi:redox-sensing transcriptional repressor
MSRELGLTEERAVVIVGAGNLGQALANYGGFSSRGFPILAVVDSDPAKVGRVIAGVRVRPVEDLPAIVAEAVNTIGVVATPAGVAQSVADRLVEAGVRSILNFAPVVLTVPDEVLVRKVDLATELQILSFYQQRSSRRSPRRSSAGAA